MTELDLFERRLAAALEAEADANLTPFQPRAVAQAATAQGRRRVVGATLRVRAPRHMRFAVAAAIAILTVSAAISLIRPDQFGVGDPSRRPAASTPTPLPTALVPIGAWTDAAPMADPRGWGATATLLVDGRVLVASGDDALRSAEVFDTGSGTWTRTGSLTEARRDATATRLADGRVLVAGGTSGSEVDLDKGIFPDTLASAELYDPATGEWTPTGGMSEARAGHTATLLQDGRVLVTGGVAATRPPYPRFDSAELYDPATGTWSPAGSMLEARDAHSATLLPDGRVLVAGGHHLGRIESAEVYDPDTNAWALIERLPEPFLGHTAELLANGTVLVAGGDVPRGPGAVGSAHTALYDLAAGTWRMGPAMITARIGHGGTALRDGRILLTGGSEVGNPDNNVFVEAELYDPARATWLPAANLRTARAGHVSVLLADGRVLVACGTGTDGLPVRTVELFDPLADP